MRRGTFILMATDNGTMIVNRLDFVQKSETTYSGIGAMMMETSQCYSWEVEELHKLLVRLREARGDGVMMIDAGANIGIMTVPLAQKMMGWGHVIAFEPQEWVFNCLAGNVAINNCLNAQVLNVALGAFDAIIQIPWLDIDKPASFGSLELRKLEKAEDVGQVVDYSRTRPIRQMAIDGLGLKRVDLIKIDVEGMELDVIAGAANTLRTMRPIIVAETSKSGDREVREAIEAFDYDIVSFDPDNIMATPAEMS